MNTDAFAITTAQAAIRTALAALAVAYKASEDARVESLVSDLTNTLEESHADLNVIAGAIDADEIDARARKLRRWFKPYAAA
jgi:hypothetical protein